MENRAIRLPNGPVFVCDPAQNTECKKHSCVHNPAARFPECRMTHDPAFAVDPTTPYTHINAPTGQYLTESEAAQLEASSDG